MISHGPPVTDAERSRIREMHAQGVPVDKIMRTLSRSKGTIWRAINNLKRGECIARPPRERAASTTQWRRALGAEKAALSRWDVDSVAYENGDPHVVRRPITLHRLAFERDEIVTVCPYCNTSF
jgi:IS30 family transposase